MYTLPPLGWFLPLTWLTPWSYHYEKHVMCLSSFCFRHLVPESSNVPLWLGSVTPPLHPTFSLLQTATSLPLQTTDSICFGSLVPSIQVHDFWGNSMPNSCLMGLLSIVAVFVRSHCVIRFVWPSFQLIVILVIICGILLSSVFFLSLHFLRSLSDCRWAGRCTEEGIHKVDQCPVDESELYAYNGSSHPIMMSVAHPVEMGWGKDPFITSSCACDAISCQIHA